MNRDRVEKALRVAGLEVVVGKPADEFPEYGYREDELIELIGDSEILLVSTRDRVTRPVLEACGNLIAVVKASIGVEKIDMKAATDLGILVCNSPAPENFIGVAEAVVGLIVALMKRLKFNEQVIRRGGWKKEEDVGQLIMGKAIGLVGLGRVGREVARRLQTWGTRLLACDPYVGPEVARELGVEMLPLGEVLRISDVVSLHVVLTPETYRMIGLRELRIMKPSAYLVNTSRGGVINQEELVLALREGMIAGAALDVFEEEPLPMESPLRAVDPTRLILTPHIIGNNLASRESGTRMAIRSIQSLLQGDPPETVLNPEAIPRWRERVSRLAQ